MKKTREVTITETYRECDFCKVELDKHSWRYGCVMCNRDMCAKHIGQSTEDGCLCSACSQTYEIVYGSGEEYGAVGVVNKVTGEDVKAPYL